MRQGSGFVRKEISRMKKFIALVFISILAMAMMLTSCSGGSFACTTIDEKSATFEAEKATTDMEVTTGTLVVAEGESVSFDSTGLTDGGVHFDLISAEGLDDPEEVPDISEMDVILTAECAPQEINTFTFAAGEYLIHAVVTERATGTIKVTVDPSVDDSSASAWTEAASTDEAGEKAGVGLFLCDPQGTSLGKVIDSDYHYMEGVAEAHYGIAAVSLTVHKGLPTIENGDVSFDYTEYSHNWTWDIDGTEIKCWGNREGEATKSIWTKGDYAYSINALGEGGDTDYGLSQEDFTIIFNDLQ